MTSPDGETNQGGKLLHLLISSMKMKQNNDDISKETPSKRQFYHKYTLEIKMKVIIEDKKSGNK
jgi:hypothetical protein